MPTRPARKSPKTQLSKEVIQARFLVAVFVIALLVVLILPWVAR